MKNNIILENKNNDSILYDSEIDSEIEYEEITCDTIEYKGIQYLLDRCNNNVYSKETDNHFIGKYNKNKTLIDFNAIE